MPQPATPLKYLNRVTIESSIFLPTFLLATAVRNALTVQPACFNMLLGVAAS